MFNTIKSFLASPRFLSFVGRALALAGIAGVTYITTNIDVLNLPTIVVSLVGLFGAEIIGALKNVANEQPAGFSRPNA